MADFEDQTRSLERELDGLFASVSVSLAPSVVEALADEQIDKEALLALRPDDLVELNLDGETERRVLEAQKLLSREASLEALLDAFVAEADAAQAELAARDEAIRAAVERCVRRERAFGPEATVELFGSALNGLRVGWSADVDLCVRSPAHARDADAARRAADEAAALEAASGAVAIARRARDCASKLRTARDAAARAAARRRDAEAAGDAKAAARHAERAAHHADRVPDLEADDAAARAAATPAVDAAVRARERADRLADKCKKVVYPLSKALRAANFADLEVVRHARVPLVKASFRGVAVDVVPGNDLAVVNSRLLRAYCGQRDCRRLCLLAKRWAGARGLNRAPDGFLSSYAHTLTVLHFCLVEGVLARADIDRRFGTSRPDFEILSLGPIRVDSADFWTDRLRSSSPRSTAEESGADRSITLTLKSGRRFDVRAGPRGRPPRCRGARGRAEGVAPGPRRHLRRPGPAAGLRAVPARAAAGLLCLHGRRRERRRRAELPRARAGRRRQGRRLPLPEGALEAQVRGRGGPVRRAAQRRGPVPRARRASEPRRRGDPRGRRIFNPTSMRAYATVSTQALRPGFENSTRAIDPSKDQPNRLRCDRAREF